MTTTSTTSLDVQLLRQQAGMTAAVVQMTVDGITHEDSLAQPKPAGNSFNWVLGHLLTVYNSSLPLLGQESVIDEARIKRYERGAAPFTDPAREALDFQELLSAWNAATARFDAGLAQLDPSILDRPAPHSPTNDPNETIRSLLATIAFHQAYHAGQLGVLRRVAGKAGAIK
jgi:uncharacterized damage-inducible protein DinB